MKQRRLYLLYILGYTIYCAVYMCRFNLSTASLMLETQGILNVVQYGLMCSFFSVTYSIGRVVNGYLGDLLHSHIMIIVGILLTGISNVLISRFPSFEWMLVLWALNGYAQSMIWGALLRATVEPFPASLRDILGALLISSVALGSILGILLADFFINQEHLGNVFFVPGTWSIILGIIALIFSKNIVANKVYPIGRLGHPFQQLKAISPMVLPAFFHG